MPRTTSWIQPAPCLLWICGQRWIQGETGDLWSRCNSISQGCTAPSPAGQGRNRIKRHRPKNEISISWYTKWLPVSQCKHDKTITEYGRSSCTTASPCRVFPWLSDYRGEYRAKLFAARLFIPSSNISTTQCQDSCWHQSWETAFPPQIIAEQ